MTDGWAAGRLRRLLFGRMYEDHGVELSVFPPGARVLTIASAGDTTAALAAAGHRVTAVDINPVQLAYARQRLAGGPTRTGSAERVLNAGRAAVRALLPAWRPAAMTDFLQLTDVAAQAAYWRDELDRPAFRALLSAALRPLAAVLPRGLREVAGGRLDAILRRRVADALGSYPNASNQWARQLFLGAYPDPLPVADVDWVCADVVDHLASVPAGWYGAASLSNILDGPPLDGLAAALRRAVHGPVVIRTFGDRSPLPGRRIPDRALLWGSATVFGE